MNEFEKAQAGREARQAAGTTTPRSSAVLADIAIKRYVVTQQHHEQELEEPTEETTPDEPS